MKSVLVAMSGGVDSSVAAFLLREQGYSCRGAMMKLYTNEDAGVPRENGCCTLADAEDARGVADRLDIPFHMFNFTGHFAKQVIRRFVDAYRRGMTPNPCIDCNRFIKYEHFLRRARELGIDHIATGHYARVEKENGRFLLKIVSSVFDILEQSHELNKVSANMALKGNDSLSTTMRLTEIIVLIVAIMIVMAFVFYLTNQIATPLKFMALALNHMSAIISKSAGDKEKTLRSAQKLMSSSRHLLSIVNDVLDVAKIESGKFDLTCEPFHLRVSLDDVTTLISQRSLEKNIRFTFSADTDVVPFETTNLRSRSLPNTALYFSFIL